MFQAYQTQENELEKLKEKCEEQDKLIESQQREVADLTKQLKALKEDSEKQVSFTSSYTELTCILCMIPAWYL